MSKCNLLATFALACALQIPGVVAEAHTADTRRLSGPLVHNNLAIYFVHGRSRPGPVPLTLPEALAKKVVEVRETGLVNELEIKNDGDEAVFIQSGDIVKGGRQDRVLSVSMLLPPHSGLVPIPSYCVEEHRWSARPGESAAKFASVTAMLPSRAATMEMRTRGPAIVHSEGDTVFARQEQIWSDVTAIQGKLSSKLGTSVVSPRSRSSLQLALENKELERKQAEFVGTLQNFGVKDHDIVGYVAVINGRVNSAEIYPSNGLFRKMWPLLLRASATEAIEDSRETTKPLPTVAKVADFLDKTRDAHGVDESASSVAQVDVRQSPSAVLFEARPAAAPASDWIERSYLAK